MTLTGGGANIATDIGGLNIYMSERKFKKIYESPTLYGCLLYTSYRLGDPEKDIGKTGNLFRLGNGSSHF